MKLYKRPESVLIVIYAHNSGRVLMLQRQDDPDFWQSVTGSLEEGEQPAAAAAREIKEEIGIDVAAKQLTLSDRHQSVIFEIFPHFRHRYAPGVTHCKEHWFTLFLPEEFTPHLTEHLDFRWLAPEQAVTLTKSWSNAQAIKNFAN